VVHLAAFLKRVVGNTHPVDRPGPSAVPEAGTVISPLTLPE